ncbi:GntR family transcriptional regulator [Streptomyces sp. NPDC047046]|uniref:GntR family transcriptional regulator n=1 Tax=Streptomyces sp. NPDC047046 TaxID=3155378 RepID=UPI0033CC1570
MAAKKATRGAVVYARIREDIFQGTLLPAQRLRLVELAERFSVSQSVVREALTRLSEQGLVVATPQQGFSVVTVSLQDVDELTEARVEVETMVLRRSLERGDLKWEADVVAAHHHLAGMRTELPDGTMNSEWFPVHEHFHQTILQACGNARLLGVALSLRDAFTLYRRWSHPVGHDTGRDITGEHAAIAEAVLRRDADLAADLLGRHIERTSQALRTVFAEEFGAPSTV